VFQLKYVNVVLVLRTSKFVLNEEFGSTIVETTFFFLYNIVPFWPFACSYVGKHIKEHPKASPDLGCETLIKFENFGLKCYCASFEIDSV